MFKRCLTILTLCFATDPLSAADATTWMVGAAKVDITPDYPVRLNGYGGRRTEVEGVEQRLFAKAIGVRERCRPARRFKPLPPANPVSS